MSLNSGLSDLTSRDIGDSDLLLFRDISAEHEAKALITVGSLEEEEEEEEENDSQTQVEKNLLNTTKLLFCGKMEGRLNRPAQLGKAVSLHPNTWSHHMTNMWSHHMI